MLEVTPPGHDANIIMPTAISFVIPIRETMINAVMGSKIIWLMIPTKNAFGLRSKLTKSFGVRPKPRVNIINTRESGKKISMIIILFFP